jgi:hypothetical protein
VKRIFIYSLYFLVCLPGKAQSLGAYFENTAREAVDIQVLLPADRAYDTAVHTILIDPSPFLEPLVKLSMEDREYQIELADIDIPGICIDAIAGRIADGPRFTVKTGGNIPHEAISSGLTWVDIDTLCRREQVEGVILLNKMEISLHSSVQQVYENTYTPGYYQAYTASIEVVVHVSWSFYMPSNRQEIKKDTSIIEDINSDEWDYPDSALAELPGYAELLRDYAFSAGEISAIAFSPVWVSEERTYYLNGNADMRLAKQLINEEKWDEAFAIWRKYTDNKNTALAKHASYNTILSYEIQGDLETALKWANKTYDTFRLESASTYGDLLKDRIREKETIEMQLGIKH